MAKRPTVPVYRRQKQRGRADQAFVVLDGRRHYLGAYDSPMSHAAYQKLVGEWLQGGGTLPPPPSEMTVVELLAAYVKHAEQHYRGPDGRPTTGLRNVKNAIRWLRDLYGKTAVAEFTVRDLLAVRAATIDAGYSRPHINKTVDLMRRVFRWGVTLGYVTSELKNALDAVEGLKAGRSAAPETDPVEPIAEHIVEQTIVELAPTLVAMVRMQWLTGMRPGEVVIADARPGHERQRLGLRPGLPQDRAPRTPPEDLLGAEGPGGHQAVAEDRTRRLRLQSGGGRAGASQAAARWPSHPL